MLRGPEQVEGLLRVAQRAVVLAEALQDERRRDVAAPRRRGRERLHGYDDLACGAAAASSRAPMPSTDRGLAVTQVD
jgi:hypothetical protein